MARKPQSAAAGNSHLQGGAGGPVRVHTDSRTRLYEFHGHLGPYVVLGFRAARHACSLLQSPGYFDLAAEVTCPRTPPQSCFLDGVQVGSGCTLGKGNLTVRAGPEIECTFRRKGGGAVRVVLKRTAVSLIRSWIEEVGVEGAGEKAWLVPRDQVFSCTQEKRQ